MTFHNSTEIEPLIKVEDLSVDFVMPEGVVNAVDSVSFYINPGETVALVGESGSGKSVTALSLMQLLPYPKARHRTGSIMCQDQELIGATPQVMNTIRGNRIGMVFQEPLSALNPLHRVRKQIGEVLIHHHSLSSDALKNRILDLLNLVGIRDPENKINSWPHQLSGGERQRVMIAMALANEPDLLIADEPTTALDVTVQAQILELLQHLQKMLGMAILLITHDLGVVEKISDRVYVMRNGQIIEEGITQSIFANPQQDYTQELIEADPGKRIRVNTSRVTNNDPHESILLSVDQLKVWFPIKRGVLQRTVDHVKAVDDVSFDLGRQETLGVVGESGSGKTTIALAILKLINSEGDIVFDGVNIQNAPDEQLRDIRKRIQMVFQDPFASLSPRMSILDIVAEGLDVHAKITDEYEREERVIKALEQMDLSADILHRYPHEFSGGERQRIAIARAAITQPELILLDEPTSSVDRSVQAQILDLLLQLQENTKVSYLFISHDLKVVRALADSVIVMRNGKAVEQGDAHSIFNNPIHDYTRELMRAAFELRTRNTDPGRAA